MHQPDLAGRLVIQPHVLDLVPHEAVAEHAELPGPGVVPDAHRCIELAAEALQHAHRLRAAADQGGRRVQQVRQQVPHPAVRVVDGHLGGAARQRAAHRGVDILGHHHPAPLVVLAAGLDVAGVDEPGHALHVRADVDPHCDPAFRLEPARSTGPLAGPDRLPPACCATG